MMNRLRRIASLPGVRRVLLHPAVRRRVAAVLALRFLRAARLTTTPVVFVARELMPRRSTHDYALRHGGRARVRHGQDLEAFHELFLAGEYLPPSPLRGRLTNPQRILDVGGNVGMFANWATLQWPEATTVSFEPDPDNIRAFRDWLRHDPRPVQLVESAASVASGRVVHAGGSGAGSRFVVSATATEGIEAVDLFDHLPTADLVKLDIEGGEWPILADPRLSSLDDLVIVLEYHRAGAPRLPAEDAARDLLEAAGFTCGFARPNHWGHGILWAWKPDATGSH